MRARCRRDDGADRAVPPRAARDYYVEGGLIWLDADTLVREKTGSKRSLDDFARAFHGGNDGSYVPVTYTFAEIVKALDGVVAHDWATFLRMRLDGVGKVPLDGIARGGYSSCSPASPASTGSPAKTSA